MMQPGLVRILTGSSSSPSFAGKGGEHLARGRAERLVSMLDVEVARKAKRQEVSSISWSERFMKLERRHVSVDFV